MKCPMYNNYSVDDKEKTVIHFWKVFRLNFGEIPTYTGISDTPQYIMGDKVLV